MKETKFKQTEVGLIPSDWEETYLGNIGPVKMCKRVMKYQTSEKGDIPFYKIGTFGKSPDAYISKDLYHYLKNKYSFPQKGTVLISAAGTIGRTVVYDGKDAFFQDSNIVWLENDESVLANQYLYYLYQVVEWKTENGGAVSRLYNDNFKITPIAIPSSKKEQQRIANALSDVDSLIANLEKLIDKKKNIKQGAMQQLLTGKKRLPGFGSDERRKECHSERSAKREVEESNGYKMTELGMIPTDWEVKSVGKLLKIGHGRDYKNLKSGNVPVYGTGGYMTSVNDYLYEGETVCIGRKGTIDKPFYHTGKIWTVDTLFYTYGFNGCIPKFIYYAFCLVDWLAMNEASGVPSLTSKNIEDVLLRIPMSKDEQFAIANVLSDMDAEISAFETKLAKYRTLKTGMMQQLLTGKIRLL